MDKREKKFPLRGVIFILLLVLLSGVVMLGYKIGDDRSYGNISGFDDVDDYKLDAVFIGGSDIHAFWQPAFAWETHGITSWNYSVDSFRMTAIKNFIIEARKTQPDALFVISCSCMKKTDVDAPEIHRIVDYFPLSSNKIDLINRLCADAGITGIDKLEYYFTGIRFHSRILPKMWEFKQPDTTYLSSIVFEPFFNNCVDVTDSYIVTDERAELTQTQTARLAELLDFLDSEKINALFITVPQALGGDGSDDFAVINSIEDVIASRGFPCVDMLRSYEKLGIKTDKDFYNLYHTNIRGSYKVTEYLCDYLSDNYGFGDKREDPGYDAWDRAAKEYGKLADEASLSFEREYCGGDLK